MTQTLTLQDNRWSYPCVSALRQTLTLQDNRKVIPVPAPWHIHWHFKTRDEATSVCQHYNTDIDTSRKQMKLSLSVSIMRQTLKLKDNTLSYPWVSVLWDRHWHLRTTHQVIPVCQHYYDTAVALSRQQMKLSLCVSIVTQTLTLQDYKWSYPCVSALWHRQIHFKTRDTIIPVCQHYDTYTDTSR